MQALVLKDFRDKRAGIVRKAGDVFEVSEERFIEITDNGVRAGMGPVIEEAAKPAPKSTTKADLQAEAESLGIEVPAKATKKQLEELIAEAE